VTVTYLFFLSAKGVAMPRQRRRVIPGIAHHIVQRGVRQLPLFHSEADRRNYRNALAEQCEKHDTRCLAWCLMDNHIHLILVPATEDGLRATLGRLHTRHAARINLAHGWHGHVFEGRFWSYPMDDTHLVAAVRYVENNPVKAGMVAWAEDWPWSSARCHVTGEGDGLTDRDALAPHFPDWRAYLAHGPDAAGRDEAIELALRSGKPLGAAPWVAALVPPPRRRGRPPQSASPGQEK
jgi:putative transposase